LGRRRREGWEEAVLEEGRRASALWLAGGFKAAAESHNAGDSLSHPFSSRWADLDRLHIH
jgi:hypothetical protein